MKLDIKTLPAQLLELLGRVKRYALLLFLLLVAAVYGYLLYHINAFTTVQPSGGSVSANVSAATPHIDQSVVKQLQQLQDNSVSVKSLFDQARSNPFQE